MKKRMAFSIILLLLISLAVQPAQVVNNPRNIYDVKAGDTLWKIATIYKTTTEDLKLINGLQSDRLFAGQRVRVPITYSVARGDTLWKLSQAFNSSVDLIKAANQLTSDVLYTGQLIRIPPKQLTMQGQYILMTRTEFKDWIQNQKFIRRVGKVQIHHTYDPPYKRFKGSNHYDLLKRMEDFHTNTMRWSNISQQLTTFPDGKVAVCRPFDTPPEGSYGLLNKAVMEIVEKDSLAIENLGNFDLGHDQMTAEQRETIITVVALLMLKYELTPTIDSVTYHHWWDINTGERVLDNGAGHAIKSCPGTGFFGGNTTASAQANFYPLILQKMKDIMK